MSPLAQMLLVLAIAPVAVGIDYGLTRIGLALDVRAARRTRDAVRRAQVLELVEPAGAPTYPDPLSLDGVRPVDADACLECEGRGFRSVRWLIVGGELVDEWDDEECTVCDGTGTVGVR